MSTIQIVTTVLLSLLLAAFVCYFVLTYICYAVSIRRNGLIGKFINKKFTGEMGNYGIDRNFWASQKVEKLSIENDNLKLAGFYVENPKEKTNKLAIIIHGYFSNHLDMTVQAKIFQDLGYNIFCPDLRAHGESKGKTVGMGYFDKKDMIKWVDFLINKFGKETQIVIFGWSMGGATTCLMGGEKLPENVKCLIADCAYSTAYEEFKHVLKSKKVPVFPLMQMTNLAAKMYGEYYLKEADCLKAVEKSTLPILFIHGKDDTFVPACMTDELYDAKATGDKQKEIFEGAEHCKSFVTDKDRYVKILTDWTSTYIH